ncbi:hypothetical protein [Clostridium perfringens]|uniref:hypothetical protein n=1 Tax=Clostridium perfringens TaxID=1502 RepID=UPI001B83108F|nr:hypothetical protein [Clostridium perfringens]MDH2474285.1 hypothetical protein [Clostridium perfringens]MDK0667371.1 hypothetical protein [Clostridium perfringens]MDT7986955.1 hypothetical protein [Clostridium perfringens]HBC2031022.1 hypothetical protein [Clostridium perfringens]HBC2034371.1 hypothetical protein [Clostridium perfringens]
MNYKYVQVLKSRYSKDDFESILLAVDQDLKFNKLGFNKRITNKEFLRIINITEEVFRRL